MPAPPWRAPGRGRGRTGQQGGWWRSRIATRRTPRSAAAPASRLLWWLPGRAGGTRLSWSAGCRQGQDRGRGGPRRLLPASWTYPAHLPGSLGRRAAIWRRGRGGSDVTDQRRPEPNTPPRQRPDPNEEFRRMLERETDLSL